jgi:hypothetical protein
MPRHLVSNLLALVGAAVGGVVGFYTFGWLVRQGFYGLMIPGAFVGLGCGLLAQHPSIVRGIICALAAVVLAVYTEWYFFPFAKDDSFQYLAKHLGDKPPLTLLMIVVGAAIAGWIAKDAGFRLSSVGRVPSRPSSEPEPSKKE